MKKILITGITGKSGEYFLKELVKNKEKFNDTLFRFFVRSTSNKEIFKDLPLNFELFEGDLSENKDIEAFVNGEFDTMLHIMGISHSLNLVSAGIKKGVKRFILVHTTGIYSKYKAAGEQYRQIDAEVEKLCTQAGASLTILRPTMIYGNLNDRNISIFIRMVDKLRIFPVVSGAKFLLQPVWCGDLGKAYYDVLINPEITNNKNYVLSGKEPILLIDILKEIAQQLGVKNTFVSVPYWLAFSGACCIYYCSFKKMDYREKVQRLVEPRAYSYEEAAKDFGYSPLSFADGVKLEIEDYKKLRGF